MVSIDQRYLNFPARFKIPSPIASLSDGGLHNNYCVISHVKALRTLLRTPVGFTKYYQSVLDTKIYTVHFLCLCQHKILVNLEIKNISFD